MFSNFKTNGFTEHDANNLKHVNPFWEKALNKIIKTLNKYSRKFNADQKAFHIEYASSYSKYDELFKSINNYQNFIGQKYELIRSSPRSARKFSSFFNNYSLALGILSGIKQISLYYDKIEIEDIANKKQLAISIVNDTILSTLDKYKAKVNAIIKEDQFLQMIYKRIVVPNNTIMIISLVITEINTYARMLFKKKKITEQDFIDLGLWTYQTMSFVNSISWIFARITNGL